MSDSVPGVPPTAPVDPGPAPTERGGWMAVKLDEFRESVEAKLQEISDKLDQRQEQTPEPEPTPEPEQPEPEQPAPEPAPEPQK